VPTPAFQLRLSPLPISRERSPARDPRLFHLRALDTKIRCPTQARGKGCRIGDLQHLPRATPPRRAGGAVRGASWCRSEQAADQGNCRRRPPVEPAVVDPPGQYQPPQRRARHPIPERTRPTTHTGRSATPGPAGHLGDPRRQARTPTTRRAAHHLDEPSLSGARWPQRRRLNGLRRH
jgi:hypothetical protein